MIEDLAIGAGFVLVAVVALAVSVRLGILVGLRLDRAMEARAGDVGDVQPEIEDESGREDSRGE
jgi:hypothetical protein